MSKTAVKKKPGKTNRSKRNKPAPPDFPVLTLDETAAYLRLPAETVVRLVGQQGLPGRQIDGEWRFYKPALNEWLAHPAAKGSIFDHVGELADDETVQEFLDMIYRERGRPEVETD